MPTVKRLKPQPLRSNPPRLFNSQTDAGPNLRHLIKACIRSGYPWTGTQQWILKDLLAVVNKFGRLPTSQHKLLLVFARKAGVMTP